MSKSYSKLESIFEKFSEYILRIIGNSITFILALIFVIYWLIDIDFNEEKLHDSLRDIIISITFLSFFLVQKSVNKFSKALHVKLNELVSAHENASNNVVNVEEKSEKELHEISKQYSDKSM
jgi:low affinity Fe/Cu permease